MLTYGSLFTGIGGFDLGFDRAGMRNIWQVEIDKDCNRVLEKHWNETKRFRDITKIDIAELGRPDVICGGFPCQDLSVAGQRKGLAGKRSGLWREFHRVIAGIKPRFVVIENVPGLLSGCGCFECCALGRIYRVHEITRQRRFEATSEIIEPCAKCVAIGNFLRAHSGRNMQIVVTGLVELGLNVATCVLDSQYRGVAQRRDRVFIVGSLGNGSCAEILFESESVCGHSPPSRETGKRIAGTIGGSPQSGGFRTTDLDNNGAFIPEVAWALQERDAKGADSDTKETLIAAPITSSFAKHHGRTAGKNGVPQNLVGSFKPNQGSKSRGIGYSEKVSPTLEGAEGGNNKPVAVRRLTPRECERLQGFPDDWTRWDAVEREISDSARYQMLGNAVTETVAEWIGNQLVRVDSETLSR